MGLPRQGVQQGLAVLGHTELPWALCSALLQPGAGLGTGSLEGPFQQTIPRFHQHGTAMECPSQDL